MGEKGVYTDDNLKKYVKESNAARYQKRDFVENLVKYLNGEGHYVYGIFGYWGAGKTTGMLQAIDRLNLYDKAVYITMERDLSADMAAIYDIIDEKGKEYVFIDEVTAIVDFIGGSCFLYDRYINNGFKVVVSSSDFGGLYASAGDALFHRMHIDRIPFFNYPEARRLSGVSLADYLEVDSICKAMPSKDVNGLLAYIDTEIVNNIENTVKYNCSIRYMNIPGREEIRAGVVSILYGVVLWNVISCKRTNVRSIKKFIAAIISREEVQKFLGLEPGFPVMPVKADLINLLLHILMQTGVLEIIENIGIDGDSKYYITNPDLIKRIYISILRSFQRTDCEVLKEQFSMSRMKVLLLESMIGTQGMMGTGNALFYCYQDSGSGETEFFVAREKTAEIGSDFVAYEIKLSGNMDKSQDEIRWAEDEVLYAYFGTGCEIVGRAIIDTEGDLQKEGSPFISAEDFLLNMDEIVEKGLNRK